MIKNLYQKLGMINIISWAITIIIMITIAVFEMYDITFKFIWNDITRTNTTESTIVTIAKYTTIIVIYIIGIIYKNKRMELL